MSRGGIGSIPRWNARATGVFAVTTALAAGVFSQPFTTVSVVVDLMMFASGVVAFLWGYWTAVQRSRRDEISVAGMYFLLGGIGPRRLVRTMNASLGAQVVVGLAGALARPTTDGKPGSTLAFGILAAMLGLGLNGAWAARWGVFPPRGTREDGPVTPAGPSAGQDDGHD